MWRTLLIANAHKLSLRNGWLIIEEHIDGQEEPKNTEIPIDDIFSVVIDNCMLTITVAVTNALTAAGVHLIFCDEKHMPASIILPHNTHYRPFNVIKSQIAMTEEFKDVLWQQVIRQKISNQARVLSMSGCGTNIFEQISGWVDEVEPGDIGNREGIAAKFFFRSIYGSAFLRMADDGINSALNYGYAIIRSAVAKTLIAYGYNPVLGIHHISETNPYNLADDLMEPLRPLVDLWVDQNNDDLLTELSKENRLDLVNLLNEIVEFDDKRMKVRYAIDRYISSLTTAITKNNPKLLKLPIIKNYTLDPLSRGTEDEKPLYESFSHV